MKSKEVQPEQLNYEQSFAELEKTDPEFITTLKMAAENIRHFHEQQLHKNFVVNDKPGIVLGQKYTPIEKPGVYFPGGTAAYPSTVLMDVIPAKVAGVSEIVITTPAGKDGRADAAVLYVAALCGIRHVFKLGGAQAIAAMAFGTASVPACDKLFGPGNSYVTEAKRQASALLGGPAIDMPAGPSEVLVIADAAANPEFVAADLLSQAEHGPESQVLLLADDRALLDATRAALARQLALLPRADIARAALAKSRLVRVASLAEAVAISNEYAPEHLILNVRDPRALLPQLENAGSVFLGSWSPEAVGDYCSGTNHVLPTYGYARAWSGVSVASFVKQITVQELSADGLRAIGACAATLARAERLNAHERAVTLRLADLESKR